MTFLLCDMNMQFFLKQDSDYDHCMRLRTAGEQRKYAIIGGGFAGVATAWHLLAHARTPVSVHLFDGAGIAGGASGAAAGLLHPYSPKGKVHPLKIC